MSGIMRGLRPSHAAPDMMLLYSIVILPLLHNNYRQYHYPACNPLVFSEKKNHLIITKTMCQYQHITGVVFACVRARAHACLFTKLLTCPLT
jgi:hypothetical protein